MIEILTAFSIKAAISVAASVDKSNDVLMKGIVLKASEKGDIWLRLFGQTVNESVERFKSKSAWIREHSGEFLGGWQASCPGVTLQASAGLKIGKSERKQQRA